MRAVRHDVRRSWPKVPTAQPLEWPDEVRRRDKTARFSSAPCCPSILAGGRRVAEALAAPVIPRGGSNTVDIASAPDQADTRARANAVARTDRQATKHQDRLRPRTAAGAGGIQGNNEGERWDGNQGST